MESEPALQRVLRIDFKELDADIFCLQETKCQQGQVELELPGYHQYWNYAEPQRVFRHSRIYKERAIVGSKWNRDRRTRSKKAV